MKRNLFLIFSLLLALTMMGCSKGETSKYSELNSPELPSYLDGYFVGEWTIPGYVEADGTPHIPPEPNKTTGKTLNVVDFGAVAGDPSFDNAIPFNDALEAAVEGDEVFVPAGEYYFSTASYFTKAYVAHIKLKGGVNFIGEGRDTTKLISKFDANTNEKYKTTVILSLTESNIVISGFTVTSDTDDSQLPDPDVSNVNSFCETAPVYAVVVENSKPIETHNNVVIQDLLIEKYQRMGVRIKQMSDVRVFDTTLQKATDLGGGGAGYGISIQGKTNGLDLTNSNIDTVHNVVENCEIIGPYMRHGILLQYYAHNNLVTNNRLKDTLLDSIDLHGEDEYANEISFNTVTNARKGAAVGVGNSGATHDATGPYNYIHHNTLIGGDRGLDVLYGTENTVITNNTFKDIDVVDSTGIFVQNGPNTVIRENSFENIMGQESTSVIVLYSYNALAPEKGIPAGIQVADNSFTRVNRAIYVETHTDDYVYENNTFAEITELDYVDGTDTFELPPITDVVIPRIGDVVLPSHDNFITNENRTTVQTQTNMKFKASYYDIPYNRMIYAKFDLTDAPTNKENVYLRITGKSKDGLVTIVINGTTDYLDWREDSITWENARYHKDQVAAIDDPMNDLTHVTDFTFTTVGTEFNTYYINVTDYIKNLDKPYVTLILSDERVDNMYCEIYSKEVSNEMQRFALLYSND